MITFFRKIRYNLMNHNSPAGRSGKTRRPASPPGRAGRYFKYAIGEIILVVIGILIALQINNWNQSRLERIEEKRILETLKEDYHNAIDEFKGLNAIRRDIIESSREIIGIDVGIVDAYPTTYLDSLFSKTISAPTYNNEAGSLNVLLTSGKINLISNPVLKNKLVAWSGDVADMVEDEITNQQLYVGPYSELLENYVSWNDLVKQYSMIGVRFNSYNLEIMPDNDVVKSDYFSILNNKRFLNLLNRRASFSDITIH